MKFFTKVFIVFAMLFLVACASSKKDVKFVPLEISWEALNDLDTDEPFVSGCMVQLTNALMSSPEIQQHADEAVSFVAMISSPSEKAIQFAGSCPQDAVIKDEALCSWSASCTSEGKIADLKFGK